MRNVPSIKPYRKKYTFGLLASMLFFSVSEQSMGQSVNPFNGDFSERLTVLEIPGVGGPAIPIFVDYTSGIKVDQPASEIGLGWELIAGGGIDRNVVGIPDDWKRTNTYLNGTGEFGSTVGYLNFGNLTHTNDFRQTEFKADEEYYLIAKDHYAVNGTGLSGTITPYRHEYFRTLTIDDATGVQRTELAGSDAQFVFDKSFNGEMYSRHFPSSWTSSDPFYAPGDLVSGSADPYDGSEYAKTPTPRMVSSKYVEHFTNAEILDHINGVTTIPDFMEAREDFGRENLDPNAVGAFRITDEYGFVYHYSLPVTNFSTINGTYPYKLDWQDFDYYDDNQLYTEENGDYFIAFTDLEMIVEQSSDDPYSTSWKLTGLTGPTYKDLNDNGLLDDEDEGYWVKYNYIEWASRFSQRSPAFGFEQSYIKGPQDLDMDHNGNMGTSFSYDHELFYLKSIETNTHIAVLVRDYRKDEHSTFLHDSYSRQMPVIDNIDDYYLYKMPDPGDPAITTTSSKGILTDNGGPDGMYQMGGSPVEFTVQPSGGADQITLRFGHFDMAYNINDPRITQWIGGFPPTTTVFYNENKECEIQYLEFFDAPTSDYNHIIDVDGRTRFCGLTWWNGDLTPKMVTAESGAMTVKMTTHNESGTNNVPHNGFIAQFQTKNARNVQKNWFGTLYDHHGDQPYTTSANVQYTLEPEDADQVRLTFSEFDLKLGDELQVYDGRSTDPGDHIATFDYNNAPPTTLTSTSPQLTLKFVAASGNTAFEGFKIEWEALWNDKPAVIPQLNVTRIALFSKEDFQEERFLVQFPSNLPEFNMELTNYLWEMPYTEHWYQLNQSFLESKSLRTVEFEQDYSLAKGYYQNVNVDVLNTHKLMSQNEVAAQVTINDLANSGKLTLNKIVVYDKGHVQTIPAYTFDYESASPVSNPNYDPRRKDLSGFYRSNLSPSGRPGLRPLDIDDPQASAWSMRSITYPLGKRVFIDYESDTYEHYVPEDMSNGPENPRLVIPIQSAVPISTSSSNPADHIWDVVLDENQALFHSYMTDVSTTKTVKTVIPFEWFGVVSYVAVSESMVSTGTVNSPTQFTYYDRNSGSSSSSSLNSGDVEYKGGGYVVIEYSANSQIPSSDIRVKNLRFQNSSTEEYTLNYEYDGGSMTKDDHGFERPETYLASGSNYIYDNLTTKRSEIHEMPGTHGYSTTKMRFLGQGTVSEGYSEVDFCTLNKTGQKSTVNIDINHDPLTFVHDRRYRFELGNDFLNLWGTPKEERIYDGQDVLIKKIVNDYVFDSDGEITEVFDHFTDATPTGGGIVHDTEQEHRITVNRQRKLRMKRTTVYEKGLSNSTETIDWNSITAAPIEIRQTNSDGEVTKTTQKAAFEIPTYSFMGPKSLDPTNTNQVNVSGETFEQVDISRTGSDFVSSTASQYFTSTPRRTWNDSECQWETQLVSDNAGISSATYAWDGDLGTYGIYDDSGYDDFDHEDPSNNSEDWRLIQQTTLFDELNHKIEYIDQNGDYNATKRVFDHLMIMSEAKNTNYASFTCTGFEEDMGVDCASGRTFVEGEVSFSSASTLWDGSSHTGERHLIIQPSNTETLFTTQRESTSSNDLIPGRTYRAVVWAHVTSHNNSQLRIYLDGSANGGAHQQIVSISKNDPSNITINGWVRMQVELTVPYDYVSSGGSGDNELRVEIVAGSSGAWTRVDDFRFFAIDSPIEMNVFDAKTGRKTAVLDKENFATFYTYEPNGRIEKIEKEIEGEGVVKLQEYDYNYYRDLE